MRFQTPVMDRKRRADPKKAVVWVWTGCCVDMAVRPSGDVA
jgi:hypothetical protein